ncbi:MAG: response regulator transcription factor [Alphaproteobacteria bacterium]|nr:response regulator transcription factor [Alphaproteobacteria bacterium]
MIRVLCVDDTAMLADALCQVVDMTDGMCCAGVLHCADRLADEAEASAADVVLLDLRMPGRDPLDALAELAERRPETRVIVFSGLLDDATVDRAVAAGAWGCLEKAVDAAPILEAIRQVAGGETVFPGA